MKQKKIKNPNSPGGRKDWEGRTPRRRVSLTHAELSIIQTWGVNFFNGKPEQWDEKNREVLLKIHSHIDSIQKPLTETVDVFTFDTLEMPD